MRAALPALLLLLAAQAGAQSFVSMGRLFTTPSERAQLDAQRNQAPPAAAPHPGAAHGPLPGVPPAGVTPGMAGAPGAYGSGSAIPGAGAPGSAAGVPCPAEPGQSGERAAAGGAPNAGCAGGAAPGTTAAGAEPQEAPGLRLGGIIRRGHGRPLVIVNGEVQPAPPGGVSRGTVRLQADGHSVVLKPGQRYDPATGEIHEAAR